MGFRYLQSIFHKNGNNLADWQFKIINLQIMLVLYREILFIKNTF